MMMERFGQRDGAEWAREVWQWLSITGSTKCRTGSDCQPVHDSESGVTVSQSLLLATHTDSDSYSDSSVTRLSAVERTVSLTCGLLVIWSKPPGPEPS